MYSFSKVLINYGVHVSDALFREECRKKRIWLRNKSGRKGKKKSGHNNCVFGEATALLVCLYTC